MKVTKSLVEKLRIEDASPHLSSINVFFEDYEKGRGKVTIECDGDAWSYFWGATARDTIKEFFAEVGTDYLVCKFVAGISRTIDDDSQEALQLAAKKFILAARKNGEICKREASQKWFYMNQIDDGGLHSNTNILYYIFGDEWYNKLPQIPNPKYNHLFKIVESAKEAIKDYTPNSLN